MSKNKSDVLAPTLTAKDLKVLHAHVRSLLYGSAENDEAHTAYQKAQTEADTLYNSLLRKVETNPQLCALRKRARVLKSAADKQKNLRFDRLNRLYTLVLAGSDLSRVRDELLKISAEVE